MGRSIDKVVGDLGDKKRWREYKARIKALPPNYHTAIDALERYLMYFGSITNADLMMTMLDDLADLFEQSAADGTIIRAVVGEDPVVSPRPSSRTTPRASGSTRSANG